MQPHQRASQGDSAWGQSSGLVPRLAPSGSLPSLPTRSAVEFPDTVHLGGSTRNLPPLHDTADPAEIRSPGGGGRRHGTRVRGFTTSISDLAGGIPQYNAATDPGCPLTQNHKFQMRLARRQQIEREERERERKQRRERGKLAAEQVKAAAESHKAAASEAGAAVVGDSLAEAPSNVPLSLVAVSSCAGIGPWTSISWSSPSTHELEEELHSKAVRAAVLREEYMSRLLRLAPPSTDRRKGWRLGGEALERAVVLMDMVREATVACVESVVAWRRGAPSLSKPFVFGGVPYLLKIASDMAVAGFHLPGLEVLLGLEPYRKREDVAWPGVPHPLWRCPSLIPPHAFVEGGRVDDGDDDTLDPRIPHPAVTGELPSRPAAVPNAARAKPSGALDDPSALVGGTGLDLGAPAGSAKAGKWAKRVGASALSVGLVDLERARTVMERLAEEEAAYGREWALVIDPDSVPDLFPPRAGMRVLPAVPQLIPFRELEAKAHARHLHSVTPPRALWPMHPPRAIPSKEPAWRPDETSEAPLQQHQPYQDGGSRPLVHDSTDLTPMAKAIHAGELRSRAAELSQAIAGGIDAIPVSGYPPTPEADAVTEGWEPADPFKGSAHLRESSFESGDDEAHSPRSVGSPEPIRPLGTFDWKITYSRYGRSLFSNAVGSRRYASHRRQQIDSAAPSNPPPDRSLEPVALFPLTPATIRGLDHWIGWTRTDQSKDLPSRAPLQFEQVQHRRTYPITTDPKLLGVPPAMPLPQALDMEIPGRRRPADYRMDPNEAATAVQATARGFLQRKWTRIRRRREMERCITLQRLWRGFVARCFSDELRRRTLAALTIQSGERGRRARAYVRSVRRRAAQHWCATQGQRLIRGFLGRRRAIHRREMLRAAELCAEAAAAVTGPGLRALASLPAPPPELLATLQVVTLLCAPVRPLLAEVGAGSGVISAPYDPVTRCVVLPASEDDESGRTVRVSVPESKGRSLEIGRTPLFHPQEEQRRLELLRRAANHGKHSSFQSERAKAKSRAERAEVQKQREETLQGREAPRDEQVDLAWSFGHLLSGSVARDAISSLLPPAAADRQAAASILTLPWMRVRRVLANKVLHWRVRRLARSATRTRLVLPDSRLQAARAVFLDPSISLRRVFAAASSLMPEAGPESAHGVWASGTLGMNRSEQLSTVSGRAGRWAGEELPGLEMPASVVTGERKPTSFLPRAPGASGAFATTSVISMAQRMPLGVTGPGALAADCAAALFTWIRSLLEVARLAPAFWLSSQEVLDIVEENITAEEREEASPEASELAGSHSSAQYQATLLKSALADSDVTDEGNQLIIPPRVIGPCPIPPRPTLVLLATDVPHHAAARIPRALLADLPGMFTYLPRSLSATDSPALVALLRAGRSIVAHIHVGLTCRGRQRFARRMRAIQTSVQAAATAMATSRRGGGLPGAFPAIVFVVGGVRNRGGYVPLSGSDPVRRAAIEASAQRNLASELQQTDDDDEEEEEEFFAPSAATRAMRDARQAARARAEVARGGELQALETTIPVGATAKQPLGGLGVDGAPEADLFVTGVKPGALGLVGHREGLREGGRLQAGDSTTAKAYAEEDRRDTLLLAHARKLWQWRPGLRHEALGAHLVARYEWHLFQVGQRGRCVYEESGPSAPWEERSIYVRGAAAEPVKKKEASLQESDEEGDGVGNGASFSLRRGDGEERPPPGRRNLPARDGPRQALAPRAVGMRVIGGGDETGDMMGEGSFPPGWLHSAKDLPTPVVLPSLAGREAVLKGCLECCAEVVRRMGGGDGGRGPRGLVRMRRDALSTASMPALPPGALLVLEAAGVLFRAGSTAAERIRPVAREPGAAGWGALWSAGKRLLMVGPEALARSMSKTTFGSESAQPGADVGMGPGTPPLAFETRETLWKCLQHPEWPRPHKAPAGSVILALLSAWVEARAVGEEVIARAGGCAPQLQRADWSHEQLLDELSLDSIPGTTAIISVDDGFVGEWLSGGGASGFASRKILEVVTAEQKEGDEELEAVPNDGWLGNDRIDEGMDSSEIQVEKAPSFHGLGPSKRRPLVSLDDMPQDSDGTLGWTRASALAAATHAAAKTDAAAGRHDWLEVTTGKRIGRGLPPADGDDGEGGWVSAHERILRSVMRESQVHVEAFAVPWDAGHDSTGENLLSLVQQGGVESRRVEGVSVGEFNATPETRDLAAMQAAAGKQALARHLLQSGQAGAVFGGRAMGALEAVAAPAKSIESPSNGDALVTSLRRSRARQTVGMPAVMKPSATVTQLKDKRFCTVSLFRMCHKLFLFAWDSFAQRLRCVATLDDVYHPSRILAPVEVARTDPHRALYSSQSDVYRGLVRLLRFSRDPFSGRVLLELRRPGRLVYRSVTVVEGHPSLTECWIEAAGTLCFSVRGLGTRASPRAEVVRITAQTIASIAAHSPSPIERAALTSGVPARVAHALASRLRLARSSGADSVSAGVVIGIPRSPDPLVQLGLKPVPADGMDELATSHRAGPHLARAIEAWSSSVDLHGNAGAREGGATAASILVNMMSKAGAGAQPRLPYGAGRVVRTGGAGHGSLAPTTYVSESLSLRLTGEGGIPVASWCQKIQGGVRVVRCWRATDGFGSGQSLGDLTISVFTPASGRTDLTRLSPREQRLLLGSSSAIHDDLRRRVAPRLVARTRGRVLERNRQEDVKADGEDPGGWHWGGDHPMFPFSGAMGPFSLDQGGWSTGELTFALVAENVREFDPSSTAMPSNVKDKLRREVNGIRWRCPDSGFGGWPFRDEDRTAQQIELSRTVFQGAKKLGDSTFRVTVFLGARDSSRTGAHADSEEGQWALRLVVESATGVGEKDGTTQRWELVLPHEQVYQVVDAAQTVAASRRMYARALQEEREGLAAHVPVAGGSTGHRARRPVASVNASISLGTATAHDGDSALPTLFAGEGSNDDDDGKSSEDPQDPERDKDALVDQQSAVRRLTALKLGKGSLVHLESPMGRQHNLTQTNRFLSIVAPTASAVGLEAARESASKLHMAARKRAVFEVLQSQGVPATPQATAELLPEPEPFAQVAPATALASLGTPCWPSDSQQELNAVCTVLVSMLHLAPAESETWERDLLASNDALSVALWTSMELETEAASTAAAPAPSASVGEQASEIAFLSWAPSIGENTGIPWPGESKSVASRPVTAVAPALRVMSRQGGDVGGLDGSVMIHADAMQLGVAAGNHQASRAAMLALATAHKYFDAKGGEAVMQLRPAGYGGSSGVELTGPAPIPKSFLVEPDPSWILLSPHLVPRQPMQLGTIFGASAASKLGQFVSDVSHVRECLLEPPHPDELSIAQSLARCGLLAAESEEAARAAAAAAGTPVSVLAAKIPQPFPGDEPSGGAWGLLGLDHDAEWAGYLPVVRQHANTAEEDEESTLVASAVVSSGVEDGEATLGRVSLPVKSSMWLGCPLALGSEWNVSDPATLVQRVDNSTNKIATWCNSAVKTLLEQSLEQTELALAVLDVPFANGSEISGVQYSVSVSAVDAVARVPRLQRLAQTVLTVGRRLEVGLLQFKTAQDNAKTHQPSGRWIKCGITHDGDPPKAPPCFSQEHEAALAAAEVEVSRASAAFWRALLGFQNGLCRAIGWGIRATPLIIAGALKGSLAPRDPNDSSWMVEPPQAQMEPPPSARPLTSDNWPSAIESKESDVAPPTPRSGRSLSTTLLPACVGGIDLVFDDAPAKRIASQPRKDLDGLGWSASRATTPAVRASRSRLSTRASLSAVAFSTDGRPDSAVSQVAEERAPPPSVRVLRKAVHVPVVCRDPIGNLPLPLVRSGFVLAALGLAGQSPQAEGVDPERLVAARAAAARVLAGDDDPIVGAADPTMPAELGPAPLQTLNGNHTRLVTLTLSIEWIPIPAQMADALNRFSKEDAETAMSAVPAPPPTIPVLRLHAYTPDSSHVGVVEIPLTRTALAQVLAPPPVEGMEEIEAATRGSKAGAAADSIMRVAAEVLAAASGPRGGGSPETLRRLSVLADELRTHMGTSIIPRLALGPPDADGAVARCVGQML
jgi:hypothetical protein